MAYLVTGGTGFIGSYIVRDLIKEGEQVVIYDLFPEESSHEGLLSGIEKARVKIVQGDITDLPHLFRIIKENRVDIIIHLASLLGEASNANPPLAIRINCEGTVNIFEAARLLGLKKVVWASSNSVFGTSDQYPEEYIPNDAPHYPRGIYGACKCFNENMAVHYFEQYGVDIAAIRYSLVYGAGQIRGGSGAITRELILNPAIGKPGRVPCGDSYIGWLYVEDAARAAVLASKVVKTKTRAFSIMGDIHSMKEAANYLKKLLPGADIALLAGDIGLSWKFDTVPLGKELSYRTQWSMEQGIKETINLTRHQHGLPLV